MKAIRYYLTWLKDQLRMTGNEYVQSVARCESHLTFLLALKLFLSGVFR